MRTLRLLALAMLCWALGLPAAHAQAFNDGSDGSYGAINITKDTALDMPADGIFRCSTITVAANATLRFNHNKLNTPVYLLATGDVNIAGAIDVSGGDGSQNPPVGGLGGPGGFDGGSPGTVGVDPGAGYGPGAGMPGTGNDNATGAGGGAYASGSDSPSSANGKPYGSPLLVPLMGGSGGGGTAGAPGAGGGGGGGAILIASNTTVSFTGAINAVGGRSFGGTGAGGSGGAIRIVAGAVKGNGAMQVGGGAEIQTPGAGRIRIDTLDRRGAAINFNPAGVGSIGSFMVVFPSPLPRLDIIQAAGQTIAEGNPEPIVIILPFGTSPQSSVVVQGRDFTGMVPIDVVLTPESGMPIIYPATIDMTKGNPASVSVPVVLPVNTATRVYVWTQ